MPHKLFIGSIPGDTDADDLLSLFRQHANVINVTLAYEKKNKTALCKGYGFALCPSEADLQALLSLKDQLFYRDRLISLREFQVGSQLRENRLAFNMRRIFVGNVPDGINVKDLESLFSSFGDIANIYFVKGDQSDGARFGYIVYQDIEAAQRVLASKQRFFIRRQQLRVEEFGGKRAFALKQKPIPPTRKHLTKKTLQGDDEERTELSKYEQRSASSEVSHSVVLRTIINDGAFKLADSKATKAILHRKDKECAKPHLINGVQRNKNSPRVAASNSSHQYLDHKLTPSTPAKDTSSLIRDANRPQRRTDVYVSNSRATVSTGGEQLRRIYKRKPTAEVCETHHKSCCTVSESNPFSLTLLSINRQSPKIDQNHCNSDNLRFNISMYHLSTKQTQFSATSPSNSKAVQHSHATPNNATCTAYK